MNYKCFKGHGPGLTDIQPWTNSTLMEYSSSSWEPNANVREHITHLDLQHGDTLFGTVRCKNHAGLETLAVSQSVVMVTESPDVSNAEIKIGL